MNITHGKCGAELADIFDGMSGMVTYGTRCTEWIIWLKK
jgi:hypothetical protein